MDELNIYGLYVPIYLIQAIFDYLMLHFVVMLVEKKKKKNWILFPAIFNLCVYLILLFLMHRLFIWVGF